MSSAPPIVFYDGVCGLCNRSVQFLYKRDKNKQLRYAALQGKTAENYLSEEDRTPPFPSILLLHEGKTYRYADAVIQCLRISGHFSIITGFIMLIPGGIRNTLYKLVSRNRYRIWGELDHCRIPSAEERMYFLD